MKLLLKFWIPLEYQNQYLEIEKFGPFFHRWLPDGEKDAIELQTSVPDIKLKIWFDRSGLFDNEFIKFDYQTYEVPAHLIEKQSYLDGGPVIGLLELQNLSENEINPVITNKKGDSQYVSLGKKVIKIIEPQLINFINILRTNFGQKWLDPLKQWDSRKESLGHYFSNTVITQWSIDGKSWQDFVPNEVVWNPEFKSYGPEKDLQFITKKDWMQLSDALNKEYTPSTSAILLSDAGYFAMHGDLKHAIIEAISALEVAISEHIRRELKDKTLVDKIAAFEQLPLPVQLIVVSMNREITTASLNNSIEIIKLRNEIIHEGKIPIDSDEIKLYSLFHIIEGLIDGPGFKYPFEYSTLRVMEPQEWDRIN